RLSYFLILIVWLLVMSFPVVAFFLATQGELAIGEQQQSHLRLFLVQEREAQGVGVEWTRPLRHAEGCLQTSVNYLLWEGQGQSAHYCQCLGPQFTASPEASANSCQ
ncbi:MAG: hypothetical protein ACE5E7_05565, partial [Anaerolineae bacterium]